jgi:hypothetical protein
MATTTEEPAAAGEGFRTSLDARELDSAKNSPELLAQHLEATKVCTYSVGTWWDCGCSRARQCVMDGSMIDDVRRGDRPTH